MTDSFMSRVLKFLVIYIVIFGALIASYLLLLKPYLDWKDAIGN